jgi:hypothetical protein
MVTIVTMVVVVIPAGQAAQALPEFGYSVLKARAFEVNGQRSTKNTKTS